MQSIVCVAAITISKSAGFITYRDFNSDEAKKCTWDLAWEPDRHHD